MKNLVTVSMCALMILGLTACSFSYEFNFSTASITKATLAKGYQNGSAVEPTSSFSPSDRTVHLVVNVANASAQTKVRAVWSIVQAGEQRDAQLWQYEVLMDGKGDVVDFTLTADRDWVPGDYQVVVLLND